MCERIQVQLASTVRVCLKANTHGRGHVTARALCHSDSTEGELCPVIVGEGKDSMVTVVPLLDVLYRGFYLHVF